MPTANLFRKRGFRPAPPREGTLCSLVRILVLGHLESPMSVVGGIWLYEALRQRASNTLSSTEANHFCPKCAAQNLDGATFV